MRAPRFDINGILLLDKPYGLSSNAALQKVKHLFFAKKAGHTGSLDPLATGMLPICLGEATKFSQYLLDSDKKYNVTMQLGVRTTTSDAEGEIVATKTVPHFEIQDIDKAFDAFRGNIAQVPSMYSALKYQGKPLFLPMPLLISVATMAAIIIIIQLQTYLNKFAHTTKLSLILQHGRPVAYCASFIKRWFF